MTAVSLHVGLNAVDPAHYQGWDGVLRACENDARSMKAIADSRGFSSTLLLTSDATASRVLECIAKAARSLRSGDLFLLTYAGHGGQVDDVNGDEEDGQDETWVLFDRMLIDDELYSMWSHFNPGVRILMVSDSCHSGTVARLPLFASLHTPELRPLFPATPLDDSAVPRAIPDDISRATYEAHQSFYNSVQWSHPLGDRGPVAASVVLLSGCQDNQTSADGRQNGLFTSQLLQVWDNGRFVGDHYAFFKQITSRMPPFQTPNFYRVGVTDKTFEQQTPFTPPGFQRDAQRLKGESVSRYHFELDVTSGLPANVTEGDLLSFLRTDGAEVLVEAWRRTRQVRDEIVVAAATVPRDGSVSVGCSADSKGNVSCSGSVNIRF